MKLKSLLIFIMCLFMTLPAGATTVIVQSRERYSTLYPKRNVSVRVVEPALLKNGTYLEQGAVIHGKIIEVMTPKRGRNGSFVFVPTSYTVPSVGGTKTLKRSDIESKLVGYDKLNKKQANANKSRISSGMYNMYKNSPFVYIEDGDELVVKKGTYLKMKFYYANRPQWQFWRGL